MGTWTVRGKKVNIYETQCNLCLNAKTYYRYALTTTNQGKFRLLANAKLQVRTLKNVTDISNISCPL